MKNTILLACLSLFLFSSCKKDKEEEDTTSKVPQFYKSTEKIEPNYEIIANSEQKIKDPWDLDFNPMKENELWVINHETAQTGGTTVTLIDAGMENQSSVYRKDGNAWHFMSLPSALAFSKENGNWATTANVVDANHNKGSYAGPTLWSSDLSIYARPSGGNGSHLDMLHGSPLSMGIESDKDNAFWVFDGYHNEIVWYDFQEDHGPGNDYHADAFVHRYKNVKVKRDASVPSHMVHDKGNSWLYIADAGNKRVIRMSTEGATDKGKLPLINEQLAEHKEMEASWEVFNEKDFDKPCGIEIVGNTLFVADNGNGTIFAYDLDTKEQIGKLETGSKGLMGIKIGPDNLLWFVDSKSNEVIRVNPN